jgi:uncharacterized protein (DUF885 family)
MNIYWVSCQLTAVAVLLLLLQGTPPPIQKEVSSLPLETRPYEEIIHGRGRVPDADRLQRLIARFKGEQHIERVDRAESHGQRIAWVDQSRERLALQRQVERLRLQALYSIDPATLSPDARLDWRVLRHLLETRSGDLNAENALVFPTFERVNPPDGTLPDPPQTYSDYQDRIAWLRGVPRTLAEIKENLQRGMSRAIVADREQAQEGLSEVRASVPENPLESPYLATFKTFSASMS